MRVKSAADTQDDLKQVEALQAKVEAQQKAITDLEKKLAE